MSTIPYALQPTPSGGQPVTDKLFSIDVSTKLPDGINWSTDQVESIWEQAANGLGSLSDKVVDAAVGIPRQLLTEGKNLLGEVVNVGTGAVDQVLGTLSKYFILIAGVLIVLVYVAGKSGAISIKSVM